MMGSVKLGLGVCDYILPHPFCLYSPSPGIDYTPDICAMDDRYNINTEQSGAESSSTGESIEESYERR